MKSELEVREKLMQFQYKYNRFGRLPSDVMAIKILQWVLEEE